METARNLLNSNRVPVSFMGIYINSKLKNKFQERCKKSGVSMTSVIEAAIKELLDEN